MIEFLKTLNDYAQLINFVLLIAIIGWLLKISTISRTALKDKHESDLAAKDAKISELGSVIGLTNSQKELIEKERDSLQNEINSGNISSSEMLATLEILKRRSEAEVKEAQSELNNVLSTLQLKVKEVDELKQANQKFVNDVSGTQDIQLYMISTVAHETNKITASIQHKLVNLLNLSSNNVDFNPRNRSYLKEITAEFRVLTQMYDTFINKNKTSEPVPVKDTLQNIFDNILSMLNAQIVQKGIDIKISGVSSIPAVNIERTSFTQALLLILQNAIQFSSKEGKVVIIGDYTRKGISLKIQDFGAGIEESKKDVIFKPFYTTSVSNSGLGLAIAKKIIKSFGGEITLSNLRMPTEFNIEFPNQLIAK